MILLSIRRRRKEIRYVSIVTFVAAFFMAGIILFQEAMNWLVMEQNYQNYGNWVISSAEVEIEHPYLAMEGVALTSTVLPGELVEMPNEDGEPEEEFSGYGGITLGTVDSNLIELGNIRLYEGRMPENENEIAADLPALALMGYDYDLGQEITIMWQEVKTPTEPDEKAQIILHEKVYTLTGTLYSFATTWSIGSSMLPRMIVTAEELETYEDFGRSLATRFYQLDSRYEKVDTMEMYEAIRTGYELDILNYNTFVYANQLWGSADSMRNASYAMILIAVIAIGYLLTSYTSKRRSVYYRYRCMGADIWQVRRMILVECLYATIPAAALGLALAYEAGFAGCGWVAADKGIPNFFQFDAGMLMWQVISILLVLAASVGWNVLGIRDKKLVQGTAAVPVKKLASLGKFARKSGHPEKDFIRRYNRLHVVSYRLSILFSILMCSILVLCGNQLNYQLRIQYKTYNRLPDYELWGPDKFYYDVLNDNLSSHHDITSAGFDAKAVDELKNIWGIETVFTKHSDSDMYMIWEGWENSELLNWEFVSDKHKTYDSMLVHKQSTYVNYLENREAMRIGLAYVEGDKDIDWEAWENGESVIVSLRSRQYDFDREIYFDIFDTTLHTGDVVEVRSRNEKYSKTVNIAALYHNTDDIFDAYYENGYFYNNGDFTIWASPAFAAHFMEPDQDVIVANSIEGEFNQLASFESTDKQLARFAVDHDVSAYDTSGAEDRRRIYQEIIQNVSSYGAIAAMLLIVFMVLQRNFAESRNRYRTEQYRLLKKVGMEERHYLKIAVKAAAKEYMWIFLSIPIGYIMDMIFVYIPKYHQGAISDWHSDLLNRPTTNEYWMALDYLVLEINHWWTAAGALVVFGLLMGNAYLLTKRYMKKIKNN